MDLLLHQLFTAFLVQLKPLVNDSFQLVYRTNGITDIWTSLFGKLGTDPAITVLNSLIVMYQPIDCSRKANGRVTH